MGGLTEEPRNKPSMMHGGAGMSKSLGQSCASPSSSFLLELPGHSHEALVRPDERGAPPGPRVPVRSPPSAGDHAGTCPHPNPAGAG